MLGLLIRPNSICDRWLDTYLTELRKWKQVLQVLIIVGEWRILASLQVILYYTEYLRLFIDRIVTAGYGSSDRLIRR